MDAVIKIAVGVALGLVLFYHPAEVLSFVGICLGAAILWAIGATLLSPLNDYLAREARERREKKRRDMGYDP